MSPCERTLLLVASSAVVALASCVSAAPDPGGTGSQSSRLSVGRPSPCSYYGGNGPTVYGGQNGLTESYASTVDSARIGALRLDFRLDGNDSWNDALFAEYDQYIAVAQEHGYQILGLVGSEAVAGDQTDWNSGYDDTGYSPYVQSFVGAAGTLMNRYGYVIKTWELWNEPNAYSNPDYANDPTNAGGSYILPQVYAKILAETYLQNQGVIAANGLQIVTGGLFAHDIGGSFSPATDYFEAVLGNGVWDWMQANTGRRYPWDGAGYHIYIDQNGSTNGDHVMSYIDAIQALKVQYSDYTPLWITEFGWQTSNVSPDVQAANIDIALQTFESRGDVAATFVFKVDDYADWGIVNGDGSPKPAVGTYLAHTAACASQ
jgi:hypothetical protein